MTKSIRFSLASLIAGLSLVAASADPIANNYVLTYGPILQSVPALELPAKSAALVQLAKLNDREAAADAILEIVAKLNPSALPTVVGAIARVEPSLTSKLTATATLLQPKLGDEIRLSSILTTQGNNGNGKPTPVPDPEPTSRGKKKGHYKGTPEGPPGQNP